MKQRSIILTGLAILLACITGIQTAYAFIEAEENEKTIFAFFTLTDGTPDYESWIKGTKLYNKTVFANRKELLAREKERLTAGFQAYEEQPEAIKIEQEVRISMNTNDQGVHTLNFKFIDIAQSEVPFFNIRYGEQSIALIVEGIDQYTSTVLTDEKYEEYKQHFFDNVLYMGKLNLELRPVSADHTQPFEIDNQPKWLMLADIGALELTHYDRYQEKDITVLEYVASWYEDIKNAD